MAIRIILVCLMGIHGLLHLLGFVKNWGLAPVQQLSGHTLLPLNPPMLRVVGAAWGLACLAWLWVAYAYWQQQALWWLLALGSILLSQLLIILYWPDAKAGSVANAIVLLVAVVAWGQWRLATSAQTETQHLYAQMANAVPAVVTEKDLTPLPAPVQRWLRRTGVLGQPQVRSCQLQQRGRMRMKAEGDWVAFTAQQTFSTNPPAFVWHTAIQPNPLLPIVGRDKYTDGHGHMLILALGWLPVADAKGAEMDAGTMLRFMSEMVWLPSMALAPYITWQAASDTQATATMTYNNTTVSGTYTYTAEGDFVQFNALRWGTFDGVQRQEPWVVRALSYGQHQGLRIPDRCSVTWQLAAGDYTWLELSITNIAYNTQQ